MDTYTASEDDEDTTWIQWYCAMKGNEFFCECDEDYIQDDFNLHGLNSWVPYYESALDMILDMESPGDQALSEEQQVKVEGAAEMLYGLIHARYILTSRGMHNMLAKYKNVDFGRCPNVFCQVWFQAANTLVMCEDCAPLLSAARPPARLASETALLQGQPVLPLGLSDVVSTGTVKIWCPRCENVYFPKSSRLDGAYFGTTFAHLFMMQNSDLVPGAPSQTYVPRIYGFRINENADSVKLRHPTKAINSSEKKKSRNHKREPQGPQDLVKTK